MVSSETRSEDTMDTIAASNTLLRPHWRNPHSPPHLDPPPFHLEEGPERDIESLRGDLGIGGKWSVAWSALDVLFTKTSFGIEARIWDRLHDPHCIFCPKATSIRLHEETRLLFAFFLGQLRRCFFLFLILNRYYDQTARSTESWSRYGKIRNSSVNVHIHVHILTCMHVHNYLHACTYTEWCKDTDLHASSQLLACMYVHSTHVQSHCRQCSTVYVNTVYVHACLICMCRQCSTVYVNISCLTS